MRIKTSMTIYQVQLGDVVMMHNQILKTDIVRYV